MSSIDLSIRHPSSSNNRTDRVRDEEQRTRKDMFLRICMAIAVLFSLSTLIIALIYLFTNKQNTAASACVTDTTSSTTISTAKGTFTPTATTTSTISDNTNNGIVIISPCIQLNLHYQKWGMPIQNYSLYSVDASVLNLTALISYIIFINPSIDGCAWSLDVFPMDGRAIPESDRPTTAVFGLHDQVQDALLEQYNFTPLSAWSADTGKFFVGITGAWYGSGDVGCQGYGIMKICFSQS